MPPAGTRAGKEIVSSGLRYHHGYTVQLLGHIGMHCFLGTAQPALTT